MARTFKRIRHRNGCRVKSHVWYSEFVDHLDISRRVAGFSDKAATEQQGVKLDKLIARRRLGEEPDSDLLKWLEICDVDLLEKLGQWGVLTPTRVAAGKTLKAHVTEWGEALKAKGSSSDRARDSVYRVMKTFDACKQIYWSDISALDIEKMLFDWTGTGAISAQTRDHYIQHLRQFCNWMVENDRAVSSPLLRLKQKGQKALAGQLKRERRALTSDEFKAFLAAARSDTAKPTAALGNMDGPSRVVLYVTARRTGFRWDELRSRRGKHFALEGDKPLLYIGAADEKHPRGIPVPLAKDAATILRAYFATHPAEPERPAFPLPSRRVGSDMVKHDLARAGIPFEDADGRRYDFHAIRGQLATDMARAGVAIQKARVAMRHSDIKLTIRHYTHLDPDDIRGALDSMPIMDFEGWLENPSDEQIGA